MSADISTLLSELGYPVKDCGTYIQTAALWRGGSDPTSVAIYRERAVDFVEGESFSIDELFARILGLKSVEEAQQYLTKKNFILGKDVHFNPKISMVKVYPETCLSRLIPDYRYWTKRGISENTIREFKGGTCKKEKFCSRFVFPIYRRNNQKNEIIGFTGRALNPKEELRWLHHGSKTFWVYPLFLNQNVIEKTKQVILVEGIGDCLSLFECGIRNVLVLFGIELHKYLLQTLLKFDLKSIILALNNDSLGSNAGNKGAEKIKNKLLSYYSEEKIQILLPDKYKDLNDLLMKEGKYGIIRMFEKYLRVS